MGYSIAALTILVAGIGFEIFRLVVPWPNVAHVLSGAISALLIVVWAAEAVALVRRRKHPLVAQMGWSVSLLAPAMMFIHGFAVRSITGSALGLLYVPASLILGVCLFRAWRWTENIARTTTKGADRPAVASPNEPVRTVG